MKSIPYFVVGLLLISSFAATGFSKEAGDVQKTINMNFLEPSVLVGESYAELEIEGTNSYIFVPGEPMLPIRVETMYLPFGAIVTDISCEVQDVETMVLSEKILPSPQQIEKNQYEVSTEPVMDAGIYNSDEIFPDNWFSYEIGSGLDKNMEHKTILTINTYPVRYSPTTDTINYAKNIDLTITYDEPTANPLPVSEEFDLVIIAPSKFSTDLQKLVDFKNSLNPPVRTMLKTTESIYSSYNYYDKPEEIKYFIKDAIETNNVKYVLLVGGLKSYIYGNPKENVNEGTKDWYVPVRYSNLRTNEPGYTCDLYYADIYKVGAVFDTWDSNTNHIYAEFPKDKLDLYPDVSLGRLPCRNTREVKAVVDKIINYEDGPADTSWFNDMFLVSGDGFLDQDDINIKWDTNGLPNGQYTIYAQSTNPDNDPGLVEEIHVTLDSTKGTVLTFNHDDYLRIPGFPSYPTNPVAEIVSVSEGNILGYNDSTYSPTEGQAYCNDFSGWANLRYVNGILYIRGKTYDPKPYGNVSTITVTVKNSGGTTVFTDSKTTEMYWEGEWCTGDVLLHDRAGAEYYMPDEINVEELWTSNGKFTSQESVFDAFDQGSGFMFFSGHGNPMVWADHYPGIPGNRQHGSVWGLITVSQKPPFFPVNTFENVYKNPVVVVGGCHNNMFNVTMIPTYLDKYNLHNMHCYGYPVHKCWSECLVSVSKRGAIAAMGNTGYGFGILGEWCTVGGMDGWITTEFFKQYGTEGHDILGEAYSQAITSYINEYGKTDDGHVQSIQQWVLFGDPSLKLGGYPGSQKQASIQMERAKGISFDGIPDSPVEFQAITNGEQTPLSYEWSFDTNGDSEYEVFATGQNVEQTWQESGTYWVQLKTIYSDHEEISYTVADIEIEEIPDQPATPAGATSTRAGIPYTYTTTTTDPNNYDLTYLFEWGDGEYSVVGPAGSGKTVSATHIWSEKGSFEVKVVAFDDMAYMSEWSEPLTVSVTKAKSQQILNQPILQILQKFFESHPNLVPLLSELLGL